MWAATTQVALSSCLTLTSGLTTESTVHASGGVAVVAVAEIGVGDLRGEDRLASGVNRRELGAGPGDIGSLVPRQIGEYAAAGAAAVAGAGAAGAAVVAGAGGGAEQELYGEAAQANKAAKIGRESERSTLGILRMTDRRPA